MATQLTQPHPLIYIHGYGQGDLWYCIDLQSLPEQLSPVAEIAVEYGGSWAVIGEHIYWAGGIKHCEAYFSTELYRHKMAYSSMELYRHKITSPNPSSWEIVSSSKKLRRNQACVFALDRKIYVLGGKKNSDEAEMDDYGRFCGEVYDVDTQIWDLCALNVQDFATFTSCTTVLMKNKEGEAIVLCYSILTGHLLFYNVHEDDFKFEVHPHFNIRERPDKIPNGFDENDSGKLFRVATSVRPVVSNSILYWFTSDLRLYGYDFSEQRWFKSTRRENRMDKIKSVLYDGFS
ncbi:hypothetical protein A4A49_32082 [Nicotiana attenuata]|uniref:F-boxkelch-repeat protein n=1 Tax=Nicotiana attenuata TaxID=49451 RepID=A0A1J6KTY9_NICAT|nr:hypothetical protein A4A49_32082 [Nicotiana attenuata]